MSLQITYWSQSARNKNIPGAVISNEALAISGTSAQSGATPGNADIVSITAVTAGRFEYSSANPTATANSAYIAAGERVWLDAKPGFEVAGITA